MPVTPRVTRLQPNEELEGFEIQDASNTSQVTSIVEGPADPGDIDKYYQVTFQPGNYGGITGIDVPDWVNVTILPGAEFDDGAFIGATQNVVDLNRLAQGTGVDIDNLDLEGNLRVRNNDPNTGNTSVFNKNLRIDQNLSVGGNITAGGEVTAQDFTETSSLRYKTNVRDLESSTLSKVLELEPKRFDWKESGDEDIGLIAEDVDEVFPEVVSYDDNGDPKGINYSKLSAVLIQAIKDLASDR